MKTTFLHGFKITTVAIAMTAAFFCHSVQASDINTLYQEGRAAFHKGDMETAYTMLSQVAAASPNHVDTQNMLRHIKATQKVNVSTLKRDYAAVVIPKLEMEEVTLNEALDGLRMLSKNASAGKVTPNVLVKGAGVGEKKFSLKLANIPVSEALEYFAQLTGSKVIYEKHAVVISGLAEAQAQTVSKETEKTK